MKQIELYTEQEKEFLQGVLELLEIEYCVALNRNTIETTVFSFDPSDVQLSAISAMMRANYQKMIKG